jgi:hypothetical protein
MRQRVDLPAGKAKELKGRRMIAAAMVKGQMGRPSGREVGPLMSAAPLSIPSVRS